MYEHAYHLQGFDGVEQEPVRVELKLITSDDVAVGLPTVFSAPRGFLPEDVCSPGSAAGRGQTGPGLEDLRRTGFSAPRGYLA